MTENNVVLHATEASEAAFGALDQLARSRGVGLVIAGSGQGKTALLRAYVERDSHNTSIVGRTVVLHRAEVVNSPRTLIQALVSALGEEWYGRSRPGFVYLSHLMRREGVRLIIVDDAQRLARNTLDLLRALHEHSRVGIALCGTPGLEGHLVQKRPELAHRVALVHALGVLEVDDVCEVLETGRLGRKKRNHGEVLALSRELRDASGGNYRRVLQLLDEAKAQARVKHRAVNPNILHQAVSSFRPVA